LLPWTPRAAEGVCASLPASTACSPSPPPPVECCCIAGATPCLQPMPVSAHGACLSLPRSTCTWCFSHLRIQSPTRRTDETVHLGRRCQARIASAPGAYREPICPQPQLEVALHTHTTRTLTPPIPAGDQQLAGVVGRAFLAPLPRPRWCTLTVAWNGGAHARAMCRWGRGGWGGATPLRSAAASSNRGDLTMVDSSNGRQQMRRVTAAACTAPPASNRAHGSVAAVCCVRAARHQARRDRRVSHAVALPAEGGEEAAFPLHPRTK
jgi:hypothetical protein